MSRSVVSLSKGGIERESYRATIGLTVDGGKVGICSAAETEAEMLERMSQVVEPITRRIVARALVREAEKRSGDTDALTPKLAIVRPGEDPWWDRRIHDPDSLRSGEHRRSHDPREILVLNPLAPETFSPYLIRGLLVYVFWTATLTRSRVHFRPLHPKLSLEIASDIEGVDRAEVVDTVRHLWGAERVVLPPGEDIPPLPRTRDESIYRALRALWWLSAATMLIAAYPEPGPVAVIAGVVAAVSLFTSRVLRGRLDIARPRRALAGAAA
jgi:hypothetical protein